MDFHLTITFYSSGLCLDSGQFTTGLALYDPIGQFTTVLALYDPFGVDVPLNFDIIITDKKNSHRRKRSICIQHTVKLHK